MTRDVQVHLRKARERLEDARVLLSEKRYAGAVNRTYYAMFEAASAMLSSAGLQLSSHDAVISKFGEFFVKTAKVDPRFGRALSRGFQFRKDADYGLDTRSEIPPATAEEEFQKASEFVAMAEEYLGEAKQ
jgi:uncharacterized protein (UPF0332 family)